MEKLILFVLIGLVLVWACYKMYFKVRFEYLLREMSKYQKRKLQVGKRAYMVYYVPLVPDLSDSRVVAQMVDKKDWGIFCQPDCEMIELHIQANPNCRVFNIPTVLFHPDNVKLNFRAIYKVVRIK